MPTAWRCGRTTSYSLAGALCGPLDNTQASPTDEATVLEVLATKDTVALATGVHAASPRGLVRSTRDHPWRDATLPRLSFASLYSVREGSGGSWHRVDRKHSLVVAVVDVPHV